MVLCTFRQNAKQLTAENTPLTIKLLNKRTCHCYSADIRSLKKVDLVQ